MGISTVRLPFQLGRDWQLQSQIFFSVTALTFTFHGDRTQSDPKICQVDEPALGLVGCAPFASAIFAEKNECGTMFWTDFHLVPVFCCFGSCGFLTLKKGLLDLKDMHDFFCDGPLANPRKGLQERNDDCRLLS